MPSGGAPKPAKPSAAEIEAQQTQTDILKRQQAMIEEQYRQQNLLAPFLYKEAGITPQYDETGKLIGFIQGPQDTEAQQIEQLSQERTLKALKGELPVDAGLMNELAKQDKALNEAMTKQLGAGWQTSTPGIQAATEWANQRSAILDAARRGDLTTAEAINLQQTNANQQMISDFLSRTSGITSMQNAGFLGQLAQGYNSPLQWYANQRNAANQMNLATAGMPSQGANIGGGALSGASMGASFGPWGALAGAIIGAGLGAAQQHR